MKNDNVTKTTEQNDSVAVDAAKILKSVKIRSGVRAGLCRTCGLVGTIKSV